MVAITALVTTSTVAACASGHGSSGDRQVCQLTQRAIDDLLGRQSNVTLSADLAAIESAAVSVGNDTVGRDARALVLVVRTRTFTGTGISPEGKAVIDDCKSLGSPLSIPTSSSSTTS